MPVNMLVEGRTSRRTSRGFPSDEIGSARFQTLSQLDKRTFSPSTLVRSPELLQAGRKMTPFGGIISGSSRDHFAAIEQRSFALLPLILSRRAI